MTYVSSSSGSTNVGQNVSWSDIGPMSSGANKSLQIVAHIDGPITGTQTLTNNVDVSGKPENGKNVTANASADVQAQEAKISVTKTANPTFGSPEHQRHLHTGCQEYRQRCFAACLRQRSSAGWHELCLVHLGQHECRPKCLLVGHRSHVIRRQQIVADRSPSTVPLPAPRL